MDICVEQETLSSMFQFSDGQSSKTTTDKIQDELDKEMDKDKLDCPPSTPHSAIMQTKFMLSSDDEYNENKPALIHTNSLDSNKENFNKESNKIEQQSLAQNMKTPSPQIKPLKMSTISISEKPPKIKRGRGRPKGSKNKKKKKISQKTKRRKKKKNKKKRSNKLQLPQLILPSTDIDFKPKLSPYPRQSSPSYTSTQDQIYPYHPYHPYYYQVPPSHPHLYHNYNYHYQYPQFYEQAPLNTHYHSPSVPLGFDQTNQDSTVPFNQYLYYQHQPIPPSAQYPSV